MTGSSFASQFSIDILRKSNLEGLGETGAIQLKLFLIFYKKYYKIHELKFYPLKYFGSYWMAGYPNNIILH